MVKSSKHRHKYYWYCRYRIPSIHRQCMTSEYSHASEYVMPKLLGMPSISEHAMHKLLAYLRDVKRPNCLIRRSVYLTERHA